MKSAYLKNASLWLVTSFVLGMASVNAMAEEEMDQQLKATLLGRYEELRAAGRSGNKEAYANVVTSNYTRTDMEGNTQNRDQVVKDIQAKDIGDATPFIDIMSIKVDGNTATVKSVYNLNTKQVGRDGKEADVIWSEQYTDTWINENGVWKLEKKFIDKYFLIVNGKIIKTQLSKDLPQETPQEPQGIPSGPTPGSR